MGVRNPYVEINRSFMQCLTLGWRPRRSIMACSWGAEEAGILGSTEWADVSYFMFPRNKF